MRYIRRKVFPSCRPVVHSGNSQRKVVLRSMAMTVRSHLRQAAERLEHEWRTAPRWRDIARRYSAHEVVRLQGSLLVEYTLARRGSEQLWDLLTTEEYVP